MNQLALDLNRALEGTVAHTLLSDLGKRMYFPKGIVAQSAEASERAHRLNATVGMAYAEGQPMTLPIVQELLPGFSTKETVAYAPTGGIPALRAAWKEQLEQKNPTMVGKRYSNPMVVPGLTAGLSLCADLFLESGDTVIIPDLFWGNYRLMFEERRGATIREFTFFDDAGNFNRPAFAAALSETTALGKTIVLLNFPNNPAGYTPTHDDAAFIISHVTRAADRAPVLVLLDDAYYGLLYDESAYKESLFGALADIHNNLMVIKVDGATKEDYVWGFRVGFVTMAGASLETAALAALEKKLMGAIRAVLSNSSNLSQHVLLRVLRHADYHEQKRAAYQTLQARFAEMRRILQEQQRSGRARMLVPLSCNSGYFMSFRCEGIGAEALRLELLDRGIGTISVKDQYLRVAFAGIDAHRLEELYAEIFAAAEALAEKGGASTGA